MRETLRQKCHAVYLFLLWQFILCFFFFFFSPLTFSTPKSRTPDSANIFWFSRFSENILKIYLYVLHSLSDKISHNFSSVQLLSHVRLFATPWTAAHQVSLSITNSWSLLKLMSIELVMPSNHLSSVIPFSSCLQSFPASGSFPMSQFFASGGQDIEALASASVLSMNIQDWFPLGWTGWLSLQSKGLSRVFSTVQKHQFFGTQLSL